jgi:hypothetical protein
MDEVSAITMFNYIVSGAELLHVVVLLLILFMFFLMFQPIPKTNVYSLFEMEDSVDDQNLQLPTYFCLRNIDQLDQILKKSKKPGDIMIAS